MLKHAEIIQNPFQHLLNMYVYIYVVICEGVGSSFGAVSQVVPHTRSLTLAVSSLPRALLETGPRLYKHLGASGCLSIDPQAFLL